MPAEIKRICQCCQVDQAPSGKGVHEIRNFRGHSIGLVGECCGNEVQDMLYRLATIHGATIRDGVMIAGPIGSPDIRSIDDLRRYLSDREEANQNLPPSIS